MEVQLCAISHSVDTGPVVCGPAIARCVRSPMCLPSHKENLEFMNTETCRCLVA